MNYLLPKTSSLKLPQNIKGRDYFVGDIHGYIGLLENGLKQLNFDTSVDRLIACGDLVDRGPSSLDSLRLTYNDWFYSVIGNHEVMAYDFMETEAVKLPIEQQWIRHLTSAEKMECKNLIESLSWVVEVANECGNIGVIHASAPTGLEWPELIQKINTQDEDTINTITCCRGRFEGNQDDIIKGVSWIVVGHQQLQTPTVLGNHICIDTSCHVPRRYCSSYGLSFSWIEDGKPKFLTVPGDI